MKKLLILIALCACSLTAQTSQDAVDSVRIVTKIESGLFPYRTFEIYSSGKWRSIGMVLPQIAIEGLRDTLAKFGTGSVGPKGDSGARGPQGIQGIAGTSGILLADSAAFTTTATRKAIYLVGCQQTWQFGVATRKNGLPVAGDQLAYWTKTDSLIVFRAVGTTSGQMFGYWRIK